LVSALSVLDVVKVRGSIRRYKDKPIPKQALLDILEAARIKYGRPREILTDRGSQFYANEGERREKGVSQFEQYLADNGIKHLLCRVNHPQQTGSWNGSTASTNRNATNSSR